MPPFAPPFQSDAVAAAFAEFPEPVRPGLLALRGLIFRVAQDLPEVGRLEETLKWGQPAYLTPETRTGTTLRLGVPKAGGFAIYAHCQTTVIADFRALFPEDFTYEGNRAVLFRESGEVKEAPLRLLIRAALTYHAKGRVPAA